ncbi:hypothetical protein BDQ17DRAFT_491081 [Cyathus striatus]|nr:hypothetical protein BDQ17DRAFT_491081 [Cyathus striatus]
MADVDVDVTDAQSNIQRISVYTARRSLRAIENQDHTILVIARAWCPVQKKEIIRRIALLVAALHARGATHGSISPSCISYCSTTDCLYLRNGGIYQAAQSYAPLRLLPELTRYAPREVLNTDVYTQSKEADVYSWACVAYAVCFHYRMNQQLLTPEQIFTGNAIFPRRRLSECVYIIAREGHSRLVQPPDMTDHLWGILCSCWNAAPVQRPTITAVVALLS